MPGPSRLLFRLPATLPIQKPLQGLPQLPFSVNASRVVLAKAEIVSATVIGGITQLRLIEDLSRLIKFKEPSQAAIPPISSLRSIIQPLITVPPSNLISIPAADIVSQAVIHPILQQISIESLSKLISIVAPPVIAPSPIRSLQGIAQPPMVVDLPKLVLVPFADIVSSVITRSLLQPSNLEGLSKLLRADVIPTAPSPPVFSLKGITQPINITPPSEFVVVPLADIVSQAIIHPILQQIATEGLSKLLRADVIAISPGPPIRSLQGIAQALAAIQPSNLVIVPIADIVSNTIVRGVLQRIAIEGLSKLWFVTSDVTIIALPIRSLRGLEQPDFIIGPSSLKKAPVADTVSSTILHTIINDIPIVLLPSQLHRENIVTITGTVMRMWRQRQLWHRSSD
jgi:hypothetical protein